MTAVHTYADPGDPRHTEIINLCRMLDSASRDWLEERGFTSNARLALVTAAVVFSGTQAGAVIGAGAIGRDQVDELVNSAVGNFLSGMKIGLEAVAETIGEGRLN